MPIEMILTRHLASLMAIPVFVVDERGDLVYFNEAAEKVLGRNFVDVRTMPFEEWTTVFRPNQGGRLMAPEEIPLTVAIQRREPAHGDIGIVDAEGRPHRISVTAYPLEGQGGRHLGAVAMFWELPETG